MVGHTIGNHRDLSRVPQHKRRSFVRAFVSLVEFDTYNRKQRALFLCEHGKVRFSESELMLIREVQAEIDDKGNVKERQKFLRLIDNYRFAVRMFCKATGISFELPTNDKGWTHFKDTVALRNRITHPKKEQEIHISDESMRMVLSAYKWFMDNYKTITTMVGNNAAA